MAIKLLSFVAVPLLTLVMAIWIWDEASERAGQRMLTALSDPDPEVWSNSMPAGPSPCPERNSD